MYFKEAWHLNFTFGLWSYNHNNNNNNTITIIHWLWKSFNNAMWLMSLQAISSVFNFLSIFVVRIPLLPITSHNPIWMQRLRYSCLSFLEAFFSSLFSLAASPPAWWPGCLTLFRNYHAPVQDGTERTASFWSSLSGVEGVGDPCNSKSDWCWNIGL